MLARAAYYSQYAEALVARSWFLLCLQRSKRSLSTSSHEVAFRESWWNGTVVRHHGQSRYWFRGCQLFGPLGDMVYFLMSVAELRVVLGHFVDFIVVLAIALSRIESLRKMGLELPPPESKRPISFSKDGGPRGTLCFSQNGIFSGTRICDAKSASVLQYVTRAL